MHFDWCAESKILILLLVACLGISVLKEKNKQKP